VNQLINLDYGHNDADDQRNQVNYKNGPSNSHSAVDRENLIVIIQAKQQKQEIPKSE
jgi:hypothetical protein